MCDKCFDKGLLCNEKGDVIKDQKGCADVCNCNIVEKGLFPTEIVDSCRMVRLSIGQVVCGKTIRSGGEISPYDLVDHNFPDEFMDTRK